MLDLFNMGGPLFMSLLTLIFLGVIFAVFRYFRLNNKSESDLNLIKSIGLFALVTGILGQLIGLFSAFQFIEEVGSVSPQMLAGGIKVSMITTIYGILIFSISYVAWLVLRLRIN